MRRPYGTILFAVNAFICWRLFKIEYSQFMGSIEGAYYGISRHIAANWGDLSWWPAWYGGIPFENSYPPLLHYLVAAMSAIAHVSAARAHHLVTGLFFCLGPVTAYWASARITGKRTESFLAALVYSVVSPTALMVPVIAGDMSGAWHLRRLQTLVVYGEGPHIAALALLPLAILCLHLALEKRRPEWDLLAALSMVAVVLTNWLGAFALAAMVVCYLVKTRDWVRTAGIGLLAYLIASPWVPPSNVATIHFNAQTIGGDFRNSTTVLLMFLPCAMLGLFLMRKLPVFFKFACIMAAFTLGRFWFNVSIVPQADRYHLEMDLGLIFALVVMLARFVPARARIPVACTIVLFCGFRAWRLRYYAGEIIRPLEIQETTEYRSAQWFQHNLPGKRIMAPGTIQFWLNYFGETPQIGGGFAQGDISYENRVASYYAGTGEDIPKVVLWFKAMGIEAVETTGPASREIYRDFANARKFDGFLQQAWREGDDTIFVVPGEGLAHVMGKANLIVRPPINGLDIAEMERYVGAFGRPAKLSWPNQHTAVIDAHINPGDVISVQENYHRGWHAANARLFADGLGFIAVEPQCSGDCHVELTYDGGLEMTVAKWASRLSIVGVLIWIWISRRRRLSALLAMPARS